jgi:hypothetical protein
MYKDDLMAAHNRINYLENALKDKPKRKIRVDPIDILIFAVYF